MRDCISSIKFVEETNREEKFARRDEREEDDDDDDLEKNSLRILYSRGGGKRGMAMIEIEFPHFETRLSVSIHPFPDV